MTFRLEAFPERYEPVQLEAIIRAALNGLVTSGPLISGRENNRVDDWPSYDSVRRLSLSPLAGPLGGAEDARLARAAVVDGSGLAASGRAQRFRFESGLRLRPILQMPRDWYGSYIDQTPAYTTVGTAFMSRKVVFGAIVTRIPHNLGRIPERWWPAGSANERGPMGQRLVARGGAGAVVADGKNVRLDVDFLPVLGLEPVDIELRLKHLFGFTDGSSTVSDHGFSAATGLGGATKLGSLSGAAVLTAIAGELVTTDKVFGGLLLTTAWGLTAAQLAHGFLTTNPPSAGDATVWESTTHQTRDPVSSLADAMVNSPVPGLGKSLGAIEALDSTLTVQDSFDDGVAIVLERGSVDFVMGV